MTDIVERLRTTHAEVVRDDGGECEFIAMFREAADEIEQLREALQRIVQWSDAYPIDIFHEPTTEEYKRAHGALKVVGLTMDAFSASMGRHCLEGVKKIANEALYEKT